MCYATIHKKYEISKKSEWKIYKNIAKKKKKQIFIDTYYVLYEKMILIPKNKSLQVYKISMKNYKLLYELNYFSTFVKFLATFASQIFNLIRVKNLLRDGQKCFRLS